MTCSVHPITTMSNCMSCQMSIANQQYSQNLYGSYSLVSGVTGGLQWQTAASNNLRDSDYEMFCLYGQLDESELYQRFCDEQKKHEMDTNASIEILKATLKQVQASS